MSNPHRGDTPVMVGSIEYTLCYDLNACALIMERLGIKTFEEIPESLKAKNLGLSDVRFFLWAGLQHHHPEFTEEEVGALEWDLTEVAVQLGPAIQKGLIRTTPPKGGQSTKKTRHGTGSLPG